MSLDLSLRLDETLPEILPEERIAVIGLGYVGLPVAVGFARHFAGVVALDIDESRIRELQAGFDRTLEVDPQALRTAGLKISDDARDLSGCSFFIITVPTPIDENNKPDLSPVRAACETIAPFLRPGAVVVLESTVYPGVTEEICAPLLEQLSGLKCGRDFTMGYSPERINPGDKIHRLETITKVVSGQDELTLERIAQAYGRVIPAGIFRAASIRTAEAAKVIENTQRDLNIALMNELAMICERMDIRTADVLKAAGTKWNFLPFTPGLVGGHCIGVDPYYLTARAHELGYEPELILAGRRLNDSMGSHIANWALQHLTERGIAPERAKVGVLGLSFKENVPDIRNSRSFDILSALSDHGVQPFVHDPMLTSATCPRGNTYSWAALEELRGMDVIILAVPHNRLLRCNPLVWSRMLADGALLMDVKSALEPARLPATSVYWSL